MRVLRNNFCRGFWPPTRRIGRRYKSERNGAVIYLRQNMVCMQNFRIFSWQLRAHVLPSSCVVAHFEPSVDVVGLLFSCLCIKRELQEKVSTLCIHVPAPTYIPMPIYTRILYAKKYKCTLSSDLCNFLQTVPGALCLELLLWCLCVQLSAFQVCLDSCQYIKQDS